MSVMDFDEIWADFNWVIEEMQDGMCLFEGYITVIDQDKLVDSIQEMVNRSRTHSIKATANDSVGSIIKEGYTPAEYAELFCSGRFIGLDFIYEIETDSIALEQMLMIDKGDSGTELEIICYREPILESNDYRGAIKAAISEFRYLRQLFGGKALYIGPDTSSNPLNDKYNEWLKIE